MAVSLQRACPGSFVSAGFVDNLSHPGGNATGFTVFEKYGTSGKWLELLKQVPPYVTRVAVLRDPTMAAGIGQLGAIQSVAPALGVQVSPAGVRDAGEIERAIAAFARGANSGLVVFGAPQLGGRGAGNSHPLFRTIQVCP